MKNTLLLFAIVSIYSQTVAQQVKKETVRFEHDSSALTLNAKSALSKTLAALNGKEIIRVKITGHTDSDGSDNYNETLSQRRTLTVLNYLVASGIEKNKISFSHSGEHQPAASNDNESGKQQNRRVEVEIEFAEPAVTTNIIPIETQRVIDTVTEASDNDALQKFMPQARVFEVNPARDTIIRLNQRGTVLHVPKHSFTDANGNTITEKVTLHYKAYNNSADMVFSSIPMTYTTNNEDFLFNSAGMFELEGTVNGKPVEIAAGKALTIDFALSQRNPDIDFYRLNEEGKDWEQVMELDKIVNVKLDTVEVPKRPPLIKTKKWSSNAKTLPKLVVTLGDAAPAIINGLRMENFGVYNVDQLYKLNNKVEIVAEYVDELGEQIDDAEIMSMIDLGYNGAFTFVPSYFVCNAKGRIVLALFTKSGDLYLLDKEAFSKMNIRESGAYTFVMKKMTDTIKNSKDLARYLGI